MKFALLALMLPCIASAQSVGQPGVTYNGKFGEDDICVRNYPWTQSCASYLQQFTEGVTAAQEKAYFALHCHSMFLHVDGIVKKISATKANCDAQNTQAAQVLGQQATGAGAAAFEEAKAMADSVGKSLGTCASALVAYQTELAKLMDQLEPRVKSVEAVSDQFANHVRAERSACASENSLREDFDMTDLDARYKLGFARLITRWENKAGLAAGDYSGAQQKLANFGKQEAVHDSAMDQLRALVKNKSNP